MSRDIFALPRFTFPAPRGGDIDAIVPSSGALDSVAVWDGDGDGGGDEPGSSAVGFYNKRTTYGGLRSVWGTDVATRRERTRVVPV